MDNQAPYPWQQQNWELLQQYRESGRLPHGLLFNGPAECGKKHFAQRFAEALLCTEQGSEHIARNYGKACGKCHSCLLLAAGNHPDLVFLAPQEEKKTIQVDAVREFIQDATLTPQISNSRVCLIMPADAMTSEAANSLLKTLEEPAANNHMILVTEHARHLAATIRSRCQIVSFPLPALQQSLQWLQQQQPQQQWEELLNCAAGAPLRALSFEKSDIMLRRQQLFNSFAALISGRQLPLAAVAVWNEEVSEMLLKWLYEWTLDLLRGRQTGVENMRDLLPRRELSGLIESLDAAKLIALIEQLVSLNRGMGERNLNRQMQLEALAVSYTGLRKL